MDYDTLDELVDDLKNIPNNVPPSAISVEGYGVAPPHITTYPNRFRELVHVLDQNMADQDGVWIELGVWKARSICIMSLFRNEGEVVYGFDSFEGLPETWEIGGQTHEAGKFSTDGELPVIDPKFDGKIELIKGWFDATLPEFANQLSETGKKLTLIHMDCDIYSATKTSLEILYPFMANGCIIVFDEIISYPNFRDGELKALFEAHQELGLKFEWVGMCGEAHINPLEWQRETQAIIRILK